MKVCSSTLHHLTQFPENACNPLQLQSIHGVCPQACNVDEKFAHITAMRGQIRSGSIIQNQADIAQSHVMTNGILSRKCAQSDADGRLRGDPVDEMQVGLWLSESCGSCTWQSRKGSAAWCGVPCTRDLQAHLSSQLLLCVLEPLQDVLEAPQGGKGMGVQQKRGHDKGKPQLVGGGPCNIQGRILMSPNGC